MPAPHNDLPERHPGEKVGADAPCEIRVREVGTRAIDRESLQLEELGYMTANTQERFLQWVDPDGRIAGFLRLSLPDASYMAERADELPVRMGEAMIREVHVYGMAARVGEDSSIQRMRV